MSEPGRIQQSATHAGAPADDAFAFVRELAVELSSRQIELPSFPDVVARIRRTLADERVSTEMVARIVAAEPALATRVLTMANSAALNHHGTRVTDLPAAIARLGLRSVRSASIVFAFEQLKKSAEFRDIAPQLQQLWHRSVLVAAMSYVSARRFTSLNADSALLAGLLHGVGKLYVLTRASRHPRLFASPATYHEIERDWHASIAKALLEAWDMPEEIIQAVHEFDSPAEERRGPLSLTDVLAIANVLASVHEAPGLIETHLIGRNAASRVKVTREDCEVVMRESAEDVADLRRTLGE